MAEDDGPRQAAAFAADVEQELGGLRVGQVVFAVGVEVLAQELEVVVGFDEEEVGVEEALEGAVPVVKVGGDDERFAAALDAETAGREGGVVVEREGADAEVTDGERPLREGLEFEIVEAGAAEMLPAEGIDAIVEDAQGNGEVFEHAEGVIGDMVAVRVREEDAVDGGVAEDGGEGLAGALHGGKAAVDEQAGGLGPEGQGVAGGTGAEGLEVQGHGASGLPSRSGKIQDKDGLVFHVFLCLSFNQVIKSVLPFKKGIVTILREDGKGSFKRKGQDNPFCY